MRAMHCEILRQLSAFAVIVGFVFSFASCSDGQDAGSIAAKASQSQADPIPVAKADPPQTEATGVERAGEDCGQMIGAKTKNLMRHNT